MSSISTDGAGFLVTVRRSKTNQEGEVNDVRFVKDGVARALRTLRASTSPEPSDRVVPLSAQMIGLRFTAAALAAGVESRVTAHSGRVGLASELTSQCFVSPPRRALSAVAAPASTRKPRGQRPGTGSAPRPTPLASSRTS